MLVVFLLCMTMTTSAIEIKVGGDTPHFLPSGDKNQTCTGHK